MANYIGVIPERVTGEQDTLKFETDATILSHESADTSTIYPTLGAEHPNPPIAKGWKVAFVIPDSTRLSVRAVEIELGRNALEHVWLTHGIASIAIVAPPDEFDGLLAATTSTGYRGYEVWTVGDHGTVTKNPPQWFEEPEAATLSTTESSDDFEVCEQVAKFNLTISRAGVLAAQQAPDFMPVLEYLTSEFDERLQEIANEGRIAKRHQQVSILIELNANLSTFVSQAFTGALPVGSYSYVSGKNSLLGMGGAIRTLVRIHDHCSRIFEAANIQGRLVDDFSVGPAFDPNVSIDRSDYTAWEAVGNRPSMTDHPEKPLKRRPAILYYSSRWGFRSTLYTLSVSELCLMACASKQWNLLTLFHEFLHTHVKEIFSAGLGISEESDLTQICDAWTQHCTGDSSKLDAQDSLRLAIVGVLAQMSALQLEKPPLARVALLEDLTEEGLKHLLRTHLWYLEELTVHCLDYTYFYDQSDNDYVASIWNSWALIPQVFRDLPQYLQRTLCAFSMSTPKVGRSEDEIWRDCLGRLQNSLAEATVSNSVLQVALDQLADLEIQKALREEFRVTSHLAFIIDTFFADPSIHADLIEDGEATKGRTFRLNPGEYRDNIIASPAAFLMDQFRPDDSISRPGAPVHGGGPETTFASAWLSASIG